MFGRLSLFAAVCLLFGPMHVVAQTQASCTFTFFAIPQHAGTEPSGINRYGNVVGNAFTDDGQRPAFQQHFGMIRFADGTFKLLLAPGANETFFARRNASGVTVGHADFLGGFKGVVFFNGAWRTVTYPGATSTVLTGINLYGTIVGGGANGNVVTAFKLKDGKFTTIRFPGSTSTGVSSISDTGVIIGTFTSAAGNGHGFILKNGVYTRFDHPLGVGPFGTDLRDINATGTIVGNYTPAGGGATKAFVFKNGVFKDIVIPGAIATSAMGVNGFGTITGIVSRETNTIPIRNAEEGFIARCQ